ncbi:hypothetical protein MKW98_002214 [Papaver atlanticum]|uniref:Elongator complex protein 4 n=1 Tax=Papaver atlanticum TaxID=357466 RepID=A0AAD4RUG2_9MAGN|nr:hypothetical protein MKW98_002214 [Papaver atlanticum]
MAATRGRTNSFSQNQSTSPLSQIPGIKPGPNGVTYVSSGIPDLDTPHHILLLRNFMSQGLAHNQPLLYASPSKDPRVFLGTLPSPVLSKDEKSRRSIVQEHEKGLRIAWQYKKYFGENQQNSDRIVFVHMQLEYCNEFDLRKPLERHILNAQRIECFSIQESPSLSAFRDRCSSFVTQTSSLSFIRYLKSMVRSSNAVAVITFPPSLLSSSFSKRWQHMADTMLTVRAIPDEDKELVKLLTGYQDMVGFLHVHKVAQINTQVPVILEATTFSIKLQRRRSLVLERLNQAPVDGSSGSSHDVSGSCGGGSKSSILDF